MDVNAVALQLVGPIYDAAADSQLWPVVLDRLGAALRSHVNVFTLEDRVAHQNNLSIGIGLDPAFQRLYDEHYASVNIHVKRARPLLQVGRVVPSNEICSDEEVLKSEYYDGFLHPLDLFHVIGGAVAMDRNMLTIVNSLRSRRAGPWQRSEIALLGLLMPHLSRAVELHRGQICVSAEQQILDSLSVGVLFVNSNGRVLHANRYGREILERRDGLRVTAAGMLQAQTNRNSNLQALIRKASDTTIGRGLSNGGVFLITRSSGTQRYAITVSPLHCADAYLGKEKPAAVVFINDPDRPLHAEALLRKSFSFTPQEARLVSALLEGKSLAEAGERLKICRATAATHLKHAFDKTGTRRQAELVSFLLRVSGQCAAAGPQS